MEKMIVIGSNSFSGAHFVDYALEQGLDVIGISRSPEPHSIFLPYKKRKDTHFRFFQCDLNHDLTGIMKIIKDFRRHWTIGSTRF